MTRASAQASSRAASGAVPAGAREEAGGGCAAPTASLGGGGGPTGAQGHGYRLPPPAVAAIVDSAPLPRLSFSPDRTRLLQMSYPPSNPPVAELSRPELKLAGIRLDPEGWCRSRGSYIARLQLGAFSGADTRLPLADADTRDVVGPPPTHGYSHITWSPLGGSVGFASRPVATGDDAGGSAAGAPPAPLLPKEPLRLWVADAASGQAAAVLADRRLNTAFETYSWLDERSLVACVIPRGARLVDPTSRRRLPSGPRIEDNSEGKRVQARTFADLLQNETDEDDFETLTTSEIVRVDLAHKAGQDGPGDTPPAVVPVGPPRMYTEVTPSPNGSLLIVSWFERPFSYELPCHRFPKTTQVWDRDGRFVHEVARLPLATSIPIAFDACREGPRRIRWRDDKPAELTWIECRDGGDPGEPVDVRDQVYTLDLDRAAGASAPPGDDGDGVGTALPAPTLIAETQLRCGGVTWGDGGIALLYESEWKRRRSRMWSFAPDWPEKGKTLLFDRNYEDAYNDPGSPMTRRSQFGTRVLALFGGEGSGEGGEGSRGRHLLLHGPGASPEGNRPFLDLYELGSGVTKRLWRSSGEKYEDMGSILSDGVTSDGAGPGGRRTAGAPNAPLLSLDGLVLLSTKETAQDPPQFWLKTLDGEGQVVKDSQISNFPHPFPTLRGLRKEILRYRRDDDVELTATLYLPPDHPGEGAEVAAVSEPACASPPPHLLPCLLWAYPREFKDRAAAGQLRRSPYEFSWVSPLSPVVWAACGFAVLDGPTFPIVAEGDDEPNDTFVHQLVASAKAAIAEVTEKRRLVDPTRVAVGGHSYGAFMAANLLCHAPGLFAAGICRSGAYNRTLTPFSFQQEQRTLWEAPETYLAMSPFMQAHKVRDPLLLIHGEDDNNSGTFPMQSERFYSALKGNRARARLVLLPYESHGYRARESVMHTLFETGRWLGRNLDVPEADASGGAEGDEGARGKL